MASGLLTAAEFGGFANTGELLQQLALLNHIKKQTDESKKLYTQLTSVRVAVDLWDRVSSRRDIEAAQAQTILAICDHVKRNPKASKADITKFIADEITKFAHLVDNL